MCSCSVFRVEIVEGGILGLRNPESSTLSMVQPAYSKLAVEAGESSAFSIRETKRALFGVSLVCTVEFARYLRLEPTIVWMIDLHAENEVISNTRWHIN